MQNFWVCTWPYCLCHWWKYLIALVLAWSLERHHSLLEFSLDIEPLTATLLKWPSRKFFIDLESGLERQNARTILKFMFLDICFVHKMFLTFSSMFENLGLKILYCFLGTAGVTTEIETPILWRKTKWNYSSVFLVSSSIEMWHIGVYCNTNKRFVMGWPCLVYHYPSQQDAGKKIRWKKLVS